MDTSAIDAATPLFYGMRRAIDLRPRIPLLSFVTDMSTVTLSQSFEVLIPQEVRESLNLLPGEKLHVVSYAGRVEMIPDRPIQSMRGFLAGMDTEINRDEDRL